MGSSASLDGGPSFARVRERSGHPEAFRCMVLSSQLLRRAIRQGVVLFAAALAAASFGCNTEDLGETSAGVCVDQGGGPGSVVRMNGACRQVELLATKTFQHVELQAASVQLSSPFRFSVPNAIPVIAGNAGNHE